MVHHRHLRQKVPNPQQLPKKTTSLMSVARAMESVAMVVVMVAATVTARTVGLKAATVAVVAVAVVVVAVVAGTDKVRVRASSANASTPTANPCRWRHP